MGRRRRFDDVHREAVATTPIPRNARVPGSTEWCYTTMNLLKRSYQHIGADQGDFTHYLNELREHRAWEKVPVEHPYGSEDKMLLAELGKRVKEIEAELVVVAQDVRAQAAQVAKATDVANERPVGTNQYSEGVYDKDKNIHIRPSGTSTKAAYRRLRHAVEGNDEHERERVAPIYQRVLAGEITANAAMVEAGFRKKRLSQKRTSFDQLQHWWKKASKQERVAFRRWISK
jgi:hypothetical protein